MGNKKWSNSGFLIGEKDFLVKMKNVVEPFIEEHGCDGYFKSFDGAKLHYLYLLNPEEKASIVISHGFCEFAPRYYELMYYLYKVGYSVFFIEHRGHGYSQRMTKNKSKVYVGSFHDYVADMNQYVEQIVKKKSLTKKYMLFAHSMGGAIGTMYLEKYPNVFSRAVLSAPMIEMKYGDFSDFTVGCLMVVSKALHLGKCYIPGHHDFDGQEEFKTACLQSRARHEYTLRKKRENENYQTSGSTYGWATAGMAATKYMKKNANKVKIPVLLCQAGQDNMVQPEAQRYFARESWKTKISRYPSAKHEIFNGRSNVRRAFYNEIFTFFEEK